MLKNYKHIIWDWNGTILNDVHLCLDIINNVLIRRNVNPLSIEKYRDIFTFPVRDYYALAGLDLEKYSFEVLGKEWMDEYENRKNECVLFEDTVNVLDFINSNGIKQSLLSAYPQKTLVEIVKMLKLDAYFTYMAGLDHIYATSKLELGSGLMKKIEEDPRSVVLIGDTVHDYETASAMGIDSILIANGHQSKDKLKVCGVPVIDSIGFLINNQDYQD